MYISLEIIIVNHIFFQTDENVGQPGCTPPPYPQSGDHRKGHMILSELPEPPIPLSEIGPIPPPPMFSTPSPTLVAGKAHGRGAVNDKDYQGYDYDGKILSLILISQIIKINFSPRT